jgi:hypothetical protein
LPYQLTPTEVEAVGTTEVRGHPAIEVRLPGATVLQWMEAPGVAARLLVQGDIDANHVVAALTEVDDSTWQRLLAGPEHEEERGTTTTIAPVEPAP